ncbi:MAG: class I SAM-dependent methyltransferase [Planctomycetota bacterium]
MDAKPTQWSPEHGSAWQDADAARSYLARPAYPEETCDLLAWLGARGGRVLDIGTGTGELARRLVGCAAGIDAVDIAMPMLDLARRLPGGGAASIRWIHGQVHEVELSPPYDLAMAGDSIHWVDWEPTFARLAKVLRPPGRLVLLTRDDEATPWRGELHELIARHSVNRDWQALDLVAELERRGLFQAGGRHETAPGLVSQSIEEYLDLVHSRSALARRRLGAVALRELDEGVLRIVAPHVRDGRLTYPVSCVLTWGTVMPPTDRAGLRA